MAKSQNDTRERLLEATVELLGEAPLSSISATEVLRKTSIARGSLYHFWANFQELLDEAYLVRYSRYVTQSGEVIRALIDQSKTREEFFAGLSVVTQKTQDVARLKTRYERSRILGLAENNLSFRKSLGKVQQQLTDTFTEQFRIVQERGWFNKNFDARAAAVFIQAYTLGKIVDDVVDDKMDPTAWTALIDLIVERALAG